MSLTGSREGLKSPPSLQNGSRHAGVAQLVERNLAKVEVDGSNPFARSKLNKRLSKGRPFVVTVVVITSGRPPGILGTIR